MITLQLVSTTGETVIEITPIPRGAEDCGRLTYKDKEYGYRGLYRAQNGGMISRFCEAGPCKSLEELIAATS